jgi:transposase
LVLAFCVRIEKNGGMRGTPDRQLALLSSLSTEDLIPADHPIRRIRVVVDAVLADLDDTFEAMYSTGGRPSVPPEMLLKATVLMAMYSMRSERAFCERLNYDMLFKWFLDLPIDAASFDASTFSKNRQRLLDAEVADEFFAAVVRQAKLRRYISSDHFSVDGTLLEAWASHKSFKPKDHDPDGDGPTGRNAEVQWHGQKRSNDTHASTTDPDARLYRKSNNTAAQLCYAGHLLIEHRSALIVDAEVTAATGYAERDCATEMLKRLPKRRRRRTVAGDKNYDTRGFVADVRAAGFTPHVAQNNTTRRSAIDGRTTRHAGYDVSQRIRKRVEEPFGWVKTVGAGRKLRYIGQDRNRAWFKMTTAVYNLIRITALDAASA